MIFIMALVLFWTVDLSDLDLNLVYLIKCNTEFQ